MRRFDMDVRKRYSAKATPVTPPPTIRPATLSTILTTPTSFPITLEPQEQKNRLIFTEQYFCVLPCNTCDLTSDVKVTEVKNTKMEVVPISLPRSNSPTRAVGLPFNKRNVEEWSRLDRLTGIMEKAKIETDHWAARSMNAAHNYGKMVDSRERNTSDGSLQERQRKQMEVFQTKVPGGSMQVIRTQTITTSSKKWTSTNDKVFEDLELPVNSLDLSSQKTKGSVGRSGSIGGRRPPTRPRSLISQSSNVDVFGEDSSVSKLCQRLHEQAKKEMFKGFFDFTNRAENFNGFKTDLDAESDHSGVVITDVTNNNPCESSLKSTLTRQKSCSNENLAVETENDNLLRRSSKVRRSLQFHKQNNAENDSVDDFDWSTTKSLKERAAEIENLLRHGSSTYTPSTPDRTLESFGKVKSFKTRDSFVSAETLKEVRDRLKKPNSSDNELKDDGIVTEKEDPSPSSKVKCFVYGMESMINGTNKKPNINGTGSLESRSSNKSSTGTSRSSEWYRRRKSYGFEQVDEPEKFDKFNNKKNHFDSSTDSGICQSSETMGIPLWSKNSESSWNKMVSGTTDVSAKTPLSTVVTVRANKDNNSFQPRVSNQTSSLYEKAVNSVYLDNSNELFTFRGEDVKREENKKKVFRHGYNEDPLPSESVWTRKSPIPIHKTNNTQENLKSSLRSAKNPWISQLRGTKLVDRNWASDEQEDSEESKRQSDNSDKQSPPLFNREDGGKSDSDLIYQKKSKKVEFCKTEVHFAAESGKFNIVETDGKPPPNDIFRRRRRSTGSSLLKNPNGLPETKFGDTSFEKRLLTNTSNTESISEKIEAELKELNRIVIEALPQPKESENELVKSSFVSSRLYDVVEEPIENGQTDNPKPRSILKNYRKSFLLGETEDMFESKRPASSDRPATRSPMPETTPVWRSTVTLRNKRFDDIRRKNNEDEKKLYASDGETELQIRIRNLRKTDPEQRKLWGNSSASNHDGQSDASKRRSLPDDILLKHSITSFGNNGQKMSISNDEMPSLSVAERVKQVEELKSNNYSTKINFRSGEMTVVQNGMATVDKYFGDDKKTMTSWANQKKTLTAENLKDKRISNERPTFSCDKLTSSNPTVMRFPSRDDKTDNQKYQTTRILINFESSTKGDTSEKKNKNTSDKTSGKLINSYGSWSPGMKKDLGRYLNDLKSTWLIKETIQIPQGDRHEQLQREDIPKPSKTVHEIIDQFDSLSVTNRSMKEKRRKTIPITYKPPKEYTHSDLEEELKNFTENLDKDFRDIYEEEIGSLQKSKKESKKLESESPSKIENVVRPVLLNHLANYYSMRLSSDEGSKKSSQRTSSRDNYDTDDSDLLADEEVRSYMSTGHGGTDSETEGAYLSSSSRKSFEDSILRFKKLESQMKSTKEIKNNVTSIQPNTVYSGSMLTRKPQELSSQLPENPKVASIALKYEDDPLFSEPTYKNFLNVPKSRNSNTSSNDPGTDTWEKTSNSSSNVSSKPRERVSYLNGLSLSEKYSKYLQRSSNSSLDTMFEFSTEKFGNGRTAPDSVLIKSEDYLSAERNESAARHYKYKYSTPNIITKDSRQVHSIKEERAAKDEQKSSRYSLRSGSENVESSRHRIRTTAERTNQGQRSVKKSHSLEKKTKEREETDSVILEELKKAADQILMAVNGYTDDSSHVGSSEDDDRSRRILKKDKIGNLGTISEGKGLTKTELRKNTSAIITKRVTGNQSSASSLESLTKETVRTVTRELKPSRHKHGESGKPLSSKTTRLLQRASSREALLPQPSSSEDIPSYLEEAKKRVVRRQRSSSSVKPETTQDTKTSSRSKSRSKTAESGLTSRTRDRKSEKVKDSTNLTRSSRSSHTPDGERTKPSTRKTITEKSEVEATKKRRSQHTSSKEEHATTQTHRRKVTAVRKPEVYKTSHAT